jgi:cobalamin biosynthesis protein CobT
MTASVLSVGAAVLVVGAVAPELAAQVSQPELDAPGLLVLEKRYAEAAEEYGRLIPRLTPEQRFLAPRLEFNRATALLAAGQAEQAAAALLKIDEETDDPGLRAAARANLAHLAALAGEAAAESDTARAIEQYQRAERLYRNALPGTAADQREAIARNVEVMQRRIARLLEKQKQEQEQQQQQQNQQDQQKQNQQQQDQQSKSDQQQNKDQQQGKNGQQGEQKDQQQPGQGDENKPEQDKEQSKQPEQDKQPEQTEEGGEERKQPQDSAAQQGESQAQQADPRDFDRAAAEILDKERKQRERIRQMLLRMRRAAPVEKDW